MRSFLILIGLGLIISSCVTNKKFILLQKDDVNKKDLPKDTTVRNYQVKQYDYRIQPEDIISVRFESLTNRDYDFLSQNQINTISNIPNGNALLIGELVDQKGEIPFPFIGKVKVAGLTVFEVQDTIQKIAVQYLESPVVKVRLLNFRFTILGAVGKEGTIILNNNRVTLLEAIGWSGGMTDLADKANVKLIRQEKGETSVQYLDLLNEDFINSPYYYVHQNDILIVPSLKQRSYQTYFAKNLSLLISSVSLLLLAINFTK